MKTTRNPYRPRKARTATEFAALSISRQSVHECGKVVSPLLPRALVQAEGLNQ